MQQTKPMAIKWLSIKEFVPEDGHQIVILSNGSDVGSGTIEVSPDGDVNVAVSGHTMRLTEDTWWTMVNTPGMKWNCDPMDAAVSLEEATEDASEDGSVMFAEYDEGDGEEDDDDEYEEDDEA